MMYVIEGVRHIGDLTDNQEKNWNKIFMDKQPVNLREITEVDRLFIQSVVVIIDDFHSSVDRVAETSQLPTKFQRP